MKSNRIEKEGKGEEFNGSIHKKVEKSEREGEENRKLSSYPCITHLVHRSTPEIIIKDIFERRVRPQIPIILDRRDVIKNEAAIKAVQVDDECAYSDDRRECSSRRHSHYK